MANFHDIADLAEKYGTPLYILQPEKFLDNYDRLTEAFVRRYENLAIGYSYKTNNLPHLCNLVRQRNGYAEVVSRLEYDLAIRINHDPRKIIFNGPVKSYEDIALALHNQSLINLDSWYEIEHVSRYAREHPGHDIKVGLRVNIDLSDESGKSHVQAGLRTGRFGFEVSPDGIFKAISLLQGMPKVKVVGLHGHCSSSTRALWVYEKITKVLIGLATDLLLDTIEYIDVGGGFFGEVPPEMHLEGTPTFDDYAETICGVMKEHSWVMEKQPLLIIEPGIAVTANCMSFITRVVDVKVMGGANYLIVDGSVYNTKPSMHKYNLPHTFYRSKESFKRVVYRVGGYTCMEKDLLLFDIEDNEVHAGDFLKIDNVGAYTIVLTPPFISSFPPIIARDGNDYTIIREKQDFSGFFHGYSFAEPCEEPLEEKRKTGCL